MKSEKVKQQIDEYFNSITADQVINDFKIGEYNLLSLTAIKAIATKSLNKYIERIDSKLHSTAAQTYWKTNFLLLTHFESIRVFSPSITKDPSLHWALWIDNNFVTIEIFLDDLECYLLADGYELSVGIDDLDSGLGNIVEHLKNKT